MGACEWQLVLRLLHVSHCHVLVLLGRFAMDLAGALGFGGTDCRPHPVFSR